MTTVDSLSTLLQDYQASLAPKTNDGSASQSEDAQNSAALEKAYGPSYFLDISEEAQSILDSQPETQGSIVHLTDTQKQRLDNILDKYKSSPNNEDTLTSLYTDLKQAGLLPEQVAVTQQALDFNPVQTFLKLLNPDSSSNSADDILGGFSSTKATDAIKEQLQKYIAQATANNNTEA